MNPEQLEMLKLVQQLGPMDYVVLTVLSLPPVFVLFSRKVKGGRKVLWFILTSLFSWLAYIAFLIVIRKQPESPEHKT